MEKIGNIIQSIANEKGLKIEEAQEAVSTALIKTAKRLFGEEYEYSVENDADTGELALFQKVQVVAADDPRLEEEGASEKYMVIDEAKKVDSDLEIDDEITYRVDLVDMGRTAVATLFRELEFHIQRVVAQNTYESYQNKVGEIINIVVTRIDEEENTYGEYREVQAVLPMKSRQQRPRDLLGK